MSKPRVISLIMAVAALGLTSPLLAQRSAVTTAELDAAVSARPAGHGPAVHAFVATQHARTVAGQPTVALRAERTDVGERALAGGANTVVISTTTIIIALLLIILLTD